ncbi:MAG: hypothetical protein H6962_12600 [Chromatiaceae bacterium]|nr:hypothetical protein [Chromatiaceae bacterium]
MLDSVQGRLSRLAGEADIQLLHQGLFGLEKKACAFRHWAGSHSRRTRLRSVRR